MHFIYLLHLLLYMPEMAHDWFNKSILFYSILFYQALKYFGGRLKKHIEGGPWKHPKTHLTPQQLIAVSCFCKWLVL